jgi:DNA replication protein DnaC
MMADLHDQAIRQYCRTLRLPTIGAQFARLGEAALRESQSHAAYLEALLAAEIEERDSRAISRLLNEARLPRIKTVEAFEFEAFHCSCRTDTKACRGRVRDQS